MNLRLWPLVLGWTLTLGAPWVGVPLSADVRMPAIFGSHMVLQQDRTVPVWGWADPGEAVTVSLGDQKRQTTASADGQWRIDLKALASSSSPVRLTVAGKNTLTFDDVLVGDVWVCSGQSNMAFPLEQAHDAREEIPKANEPQIRLFLVAQQIALVPRADVTGSWAVCTPETARKFSALAYFFGRDLQSSLKRPIGLIGTYRGATQAQCWVPLAELKKEPLLAPYLADYQRFASFYPGGDKEFAQRYGAYQDAHKAWLDKVEKDAIYQGALKAWTVADQVAKKSGTAEPPKPAPHDAEPPAPPWSDAQNSSELFSGMVAPLVPYAIKGAIWYQGENDTFWPSHYPNIFGAVIHGWRNQWGEGDFPFLFVQLANFQKRTNVPSLPNDNWPLLREAQLKTLSLPNTAMIVTMDLGGVNSIHPPDKLDMGKRLALAARHVAYGQDIVYSGPIFDSMKIEGSSARLSFTHVGSGLVIGKSPWVDPDTGPASSTDLKGFALQGATGDWVWAEAKIDGNSVLVSSPQVPNPKNVRYAWANNPECNLSNKEGLPASPFRTDTEP